MGTALPPTLTVGDTAGCVSRMVTNLVLALSSGSRPHYLVDGGVGSGKTHALTAVLDGLKARRIPALVLCPATLGVSTHTDLLWEALYSHDPALARQCPRDRDQLGFLALEDAIRRADQGSPVVLVIDGLDRVFSQLDRGGQGRLRAWVEDTANVSLLASAELMTEPLSRRSWPWFGAFNRETLTPLTLDDATELVRAEAAHADQRWVLAWLEHSAGRDELSDVYTRFGGNPRVWAIAASHLAHTASLEPLAPVIVDQLTPYVLPRLQQLSPLHARVIVALARHAVPMTVTALAADIAVTNQNAAAALGRLNTAGWVAAAKPSAGDRRITLYSIAEPSIGALIRGREQAA